MMKKNCKNFILLRNLNRRVWVRFERVDSSKTFKSSDFSSYQIYHNRNKIKYNHWYFDLYIIVIVIIIIVYI